MGTVHRRTRGSCADSVSSACASVGVGVCLTGFPDESLMLLSVQLSSRGTESVSERDFVPFILSVILCGVSRVFLKLPLPVSSAV